MDQDLPNVPTISGDAHVYLSSRLSADTQLREGLLADTRQSEAFNLGLLAGMAEARRVIDFMFNRPDLQED